MKIKSIIPFLFVAMALFASCDNDDTGIPEIVPTDYFPLNIGDTWEYEDHTRTVSGKEIFNNKEYMVITLDTYRADTLYYSYKTHYRTTGDNKVYKLNSDHTGENLFANFNLNEDDSWTYFDTSNGREDEWTVTTLSEITFEFDNTELDNCKRFFYNATLIVDEEQTIVFAPGLGEIHSYSDAWGIGQSIVSATIDGVKYDFK